jgi:hypothetical protein
MANIWERAADAMRARSLRERSQVTKFNAVLRELGLYVEDPNRRFATRSVLEQGPAHELLDAEAVVVSPEQIDPNPVG